MESNLSRARSISLSRPPSTADHHPPADPDRPHPRTSPRASSAAAPRAPGAPHHAWALAAGKPRQRNNSADASSRSVGGGGAAGGWGSQNQGHSRVLSETSVGGAALGLSSFPRDPLRATSAMGARVLAGGGSSRDRSISPAADAWRDARGRAHGPVLEPLREDGASAVGEEAEAGAGDSGSDLPSPVFERGLPVIAQRAAAAPVVGETQAEEGMGKEVARRRSNIQLSDLREQMQDLRGKVASLKKRTKEDSLQRRSLQMLKPASPFTDAESWAGSGAGMFRPPAGSAGSGRSSEAVERKAGGPAETLEDAPRAAEKGNVKDAPKEEEPGTADDAATVDDYYDTHSTFGARPRGRSLQQSPARVGSPSTHFEGSTARSSRVLDAPPPHPDDEPYTAGLVASYDVDSSHASSVRDSVASSARDSVSSSVELDHESTPRTADIGYESTPRQGNVDLEPPADIDPETPDAADRDPDVVPHESRPDAFDYETYVLDSTMGSFSRQSRHRRRHRPASSHSSSSSDIDDAVSSASVSTTRPTAPSPEPSAPSAPPGPDPAPAAPVYNPDYDVDVAPDNIPSSPTVPFLAAHAPSAFASTNAMPNGVGAGGGPREHSRQNSADSVSTVATFATATSGTGGGGGRSASRSTSRSASRTAPRAQLPAPAMHADANGRLTPSIPPRSRARTPTLTGANPAVVEQVVGILLNRSGGISGGGAVGSGGSGALGGEDEALVRGVVEGVVGACGSLVAGNGLGHESAKERRARERLVAARQALESWGR